MEKEANDLELEAKRIGKEFLEKSKDKEILVISHFDTDGITSAAIMTRALKKLDKQFSVKIVKRLEKKLIDELPENKLILFLDLGSGNLHHLENKKNIFIVDHHEVPVAVPENIFMLNPELNGKEKISSSCLTYLFCKTLTKITGLEKLAVLGMIGDCMEKNLDKLNNVILNDGDIMRKRGLLIYPSTRPLNRTLEYCSSPYIPGVTGDTEGVLELLRETGLTPENSRYKSLIELNDEEMSKLVTAIVLRNPKAKKEILGDIFLIKMFNKLEDARELSAIINACSRLGNSDVALQFCMELQKAKKTAEALHVKYKQHIISGLKFISETDKIKGDSFVIINAKDKIKDTIIGTIASIMSNSPLYSEGTIITAMAYYNDKIKVSSRICGRENSRNLREILAGVIEKTGGEIGGHASAAGCEISKNKEQEFIETLKKHLEIELVKVGIDKKT